MINKQNYRIIHLALFSTLGMCCSANAALSRLPLQMPRGAVSTAAVRLVRTPVTVPSCSTMPRLSCAQPLAKTNQVRLTSGHTSYDIESFRDIGEWEEPQGGIEYTDRMVQVVPGRFVPVPKWPYFDDDPLVDHVFNVLNKVELHCTHEGFPGSTVHFSPDGLCVIDGCAYSGNRVFVHRLIRVVGSSKWVLVIWQMPTAPDPTSKDPQKGQSLCLCRVVPPSLVKLAYKSGYPSYLW